MLLHTHNMNIDTVWNEKETNDDNEKKKWIENCVLLVSILGYREKIGREREDTRWWWSRNVVEIQKKKKNDDDDEQGERERKEKKQNKEIVEH